MHRRHFIAGAATAATATLAGCTGILGAGYTVAENPWSNTTSKELPNGRLKSGTVRLPPDTYGMQTVTHRFPVGVAVSVRATKPMDVYALRDAEYQRYRDGEEFLISSELSAEGARTLQFNGMLPTGTIHFVFDNTRVATAPDGPVRAKYRIKRTR